MASLRSSLGRTSLADATAGVLAAANGHPLASSAAIERGSVRSASRRSVSAQNSATLGDFTYTQATGHDSSYSRDIDLAVKGIRPPSQLFNVLGHSDFDHLLGQVRQAHTEEIEVLQREIASLKRKVMMIGMHHGKPRSRASVDGKMNWGEAASLSISLGSQQPSSWKLAVEREKSPVNRQVSPQDQNWEGELPSDLGESGVTSGTVGDEPLFQTVKQSAPTAVGDVRPWPGELRVEANVTSWVRNALKSELQDVPSQQASMSRRLVMEEDKNEYVESQDSQETLQLSDTPRDISDLRQRTLSKRSSKSSASSIKGMRSFADDLDGNLAKWRDIVLDVLALANKEFFIMKPCWVQSETFLRKATRGAHHYLDLFAETPEALSRRKSDLSVRAQVAHPWSPWTDTTWLIVDPQSPRRMTWALVGMLLMVYDLVMLPMQAFDMKDSVGLTVLSWLFQIFWTLDMGVSAVTSYYVNGELETRLGKIIRTYVTSWMPIDSVITLPLWVVLIMGVDTAGTGNSVRSARYFRMLRFLRLMRLVKFESLWGEALGFINSASAILVIGMAKLMFLMILINHLVACIWYAIGRSGEGDNAGWALRDKIEDGDILYKYLSSIHWTLTQFQGTSDVTPGGTLAERIYAVVFLLCALFILTIFISSLTNRMMQFQNLHSQRTYEERVVRGYLSNHDITHQLSVRIKKYLEWKQRLKRSQEYDEEVFNILPLQLMMDLLDEVRGPTCADNHPFFSAFREAYPRVMRRLCFEAITPASPMPGEQVFSPGDVCIGMYFIVNGHMNYNVATDKKMSRQNNKKDKNGQLSRIKSQRMTMSTNFRGPVTSTRQTTRQTTTQDLVALGLMSVTPLTQSHFLSEAVLWTNWHHVGSLNVVSDSCLLHLHAQRFEEVVSIYAQAQASAVLYARRFLASLNSYGKHYTDFINKDHLQEMIDTHNEEISESDEEWSEDEDWYPRDSQEEEQLQAQQSTL